METPKESQTKPRTAQALDSRENPWIEPATAAVKTKTTPAKKRVALLRTEALVATLPAAENCFCVGLQNRLLPRLAAKNLHVREVLRHNKPMLDQSMGDGVKVQSGKSLDSHKNPVRRGTNRDARVVSCPNRAGGRGQRSPPQNVAIGRRRHQRRSRCMRNGGVRGRDGRWRLRKSRSAA